jgi:hypothetical protein
MIGYYESESFSEINQAWDKTKLKAQALVTRIKKKISYKEIIVVNDTISDMLTRTEMPIW